MLKVLNSLFFEERSLSEFGFRSHLFGFRGHFYELFRVLISILAIRLVGACYLWQCR